MNTTGVLLYDVNNHPAVLGQSTSYHININLWNARPEEPPDEPDFAIHRFPPFAHHATRRQLKDNLAVRGEVVVRRAHDVKYGTIQGDPASVATVAQRQAGIE